MCVVCVCVCVYMCVICCVCVMLLTFIGSACFDISKGVCLRCLCVRARGAGRGAAVEEKKKKKEQGDAMKGAEWENAPADPQRTNTSGASQQRDRNHWFRFPLRSCFPYPSSLTLLCFLPLHLFPSLNLKLSFSLSNLRLPPPPPLCLSLSLSLPSSSSSSSSSLHSHNLRG